MERTEIIKKLLSLKPQKIEYFNYFTSLTDAELERLVSKKTK
jgi:predicted CopG family antitoxin